MTEDELLGQLEELSKKLKEDNERLDVKLEELRKIRFAAKTDESKAKELCEKYFDKWLKK